MKEYINKVIQKNDLTQAEAEEAMDMIMNGKASEAQIAGFIVALRMKGECVDEITGCAKAMRKNAKRISPKVAFSVDTCGTGGDGADTFNISTASTFIIAAAGGFVAKHGNRSVSSKCGCADVLEALGAKIDLQPEQVEKSVEQIGMGFMFAPVFHQSMKYAAAPRRELGVRTIFNILGPLTNPANADGQVLGVFSESLVEPMAEVLKNLGIKKAMVVHGYDGLDEITLTNRTMVCEINDGKINKYDFDPQSLGFKLCEMDELKGGDAAFNSEIIKTIFNGERGAKRDILVLNSAAALYVANIAKSLEEGISIATDTIDSGRAMKKLEEFVRFTNQTKF